MPVAKNSQEIVEVVLNAGGSVELSQQVVEAVVKTTFPTAGAMVGAGMSQQAVEVVLTAIASPVHLSQQVVEIVYTQDPASDLISGSDMVASYPMVID